MGWKIAWPSWSRRTVAPAVEAKPPAAPRPRKAEPSGADRRETVRYPITLVTSQRLLATLINQPDRPVQVRNLSAGGISLLLGRHFDSDALIDLDLLNRKVMFLCKLQVRVTYSVEHPSGEWIVGGSFTRQLTTEEVRSLLA